MEEIARRIDGVTCAENDLSGLSLGGSSNRDRGISMEELERGTTSSSSSASSSSSSWAPPALTEGVMFVALGKDVKENESVLMYALHNSRGMKICVLHVHQPPQTVPMMGSNVSIHLLDEREVKAYHELKSGEMHKILDKYIRACYKKGVQAEKICKDMYPIEKGIVQLICEHGIKWLVMGAAADRHYSKRMKELRSRKAKYVHKEAPIFCHIWFVCKGYLIQTREGKSSSINIGAESLPFQASPYAEAPISLRSHSIAEVGNGEIRSQNTVIDYRRVRSDNHGRQYSLPFSGSGDSSPQSSLNLEGNFHWDSSSGRSPSVRSHFSTGSSEILEHSASTPTGPELNEIGSESPMFQQNHGDSIRSSGAASLIGEHDELYVKFKQFAEEAESSGRVAYEESVRRKKAEKELIDAILRAKEHEAMCAEEKRRRREVEGALERSGEEVANTKWKLDKLLGDFRAVEEQKFTLQHQITDSDRKIEELKQKMFSVLELLQTCKKERDELEVERDAARRVADELREKRPVEALGSSACQFFSEFSLSEIEEATNNFDKSFKIGEGGYGGIYRGVLRHTQVAIKVLYPNGSQGPVEFRQEVNILSKLRHPNIVNLIGACPEAHALIYEYLPNGSLEDCLNCKNNTPPLSWKTRVRIAAELCSALIFLHSSRPQGIVHGDLKPSNILLDANFVCKLGDFGICRQLPRPELTESNGTLCWRTDQPRGTLVYIDPEYLAAGELTLKSDVYSFGIILLRLLTRRPALRIAKEVQSALDKGNLKETLDPSAGDWPFVQAKQLTHLALSCTNVDRRSRPDLASEVWRVLESMNVSSGGVVSLQYSSEERRDIPSSFVCPIFQHNFLKHLQEVMQDPVVAADGYTYESEALKGWLESGHDTSPMTNLKLPHCNLLPNYALRSAIQEWLLKPQN